MKSFREWLSLQEAVLTTPANETDIENVVNKIISLVKEELMDGLKNIQPTPEYLKNAKKNPIQA